MLRCRGLSLNITTYMVNCFTNDFLFYTQPLPHPYTSTILYLLILISGDLGTHLFGIPYHGSWDTTKVARDTTETYFNTSAIFPFFLCSAYGCIVAHVNPRKIHTRVQPKI